ncbi:hypothetical protein, partial [Vibrio cholerae]|uniref:hypothetical protein n=1 Tax=Vibrio cholerae TaxID=666 RepID=UPI0018F0BE83
HYRHHLIAKGEARAREGEDVPDAASIETALAEAGLTQLDATRRQIDALCPGLRRIQAACAEKADHEQAVRFDKLAPLAQGMFTLLDA